MTASTTTLERSLLAMAKGESRVFAFEDLGPLAIQKAAKSFAFRQGFTVSVRADYGGVRITKLRDTITARIGRILDAMADGERREIELEIADMGSLRIEMGKRNDTGLVAFEYQPTPIGAMVHRVDRFTADGLNDDAFDFAQLQHMPEALFAAPVKAEKAFAKKLARVSLMVHRPLCYIRESDTQILVFTPESETT